LRLSIPYIRGGVQHYSTTIHFVVYRCKLRHAAATRNTTRLRVVSTSSERSSDLPAVTARPFAGSAVQPPRTHPSLAFFPALSRLSPRAVAVQARPTTHRRAKFHFQMQAARDYDDDDDGGYSVCYCRSHVAAPRAMTRFVTGS